MRDDLYFAGEVTVDLPVTNLKASQKWYKEVLGCEVEHAQVEGGATPTSNVYDIEGARARMEGLGVRFDGPIRDVGGLVKLTTFFDPDGHKWMLAESPDDTGRARKA
jgi:predicted lactoylglutathione lyase